MEPLLACFSTPAAPLYRLSGSCIVVLCGTVNGNNDGDGVFTGGMVGGLAWLGFAGVGGAREACSEAGRQLSTVSRTRHTNVGAAEFALYFSPESESAAAGANCSGSTPAQLPHQPPFSSTQ